MTIHRVSDLCVKSDYSMAHLNSRAEYKIGGMITFHS